MKRNKIFLNSLYKNNRFLVNGGPLRMSLLQFHEVLGIDAICISGSF